MGCGPGSLPVATSSAAQPSPASPALLAAYFGSYRAGDGDILIVARLGWFFDTGDGAYRTLYATDAPNRFTIGFRFLEPSPAFAVIVFDAGTITVTESSRRRVAQRITYKQTDVAVPAAGAELAATITDPLGSGAHPGIVVVHGAERGERYFYDIWVGVYASMGLAVLTYDKRGIGSSTGIYPGEAPTVAALTTYADDAAAMLSFLSRWPGVDASRVGFHGGSQGGWTVPLAMERHPGAAFDVLASAPATTVDQTDQWAGYTGGGASAPLEAESRMESEVQAIHTGYDPRSAIEALRTPTLWLLGTNDRTVPTAICLQILSTLNKPNFSVHVLPTGHALLVNPTGLLADDARSPGLALEMVPSLRQWMIRNVTQAG
jgi:hypothetical protein